MEGLRNLYCYLFMFLMFLSDLKCVCNGDTCLQKGPCTCEFPNGTGIDLAPAGIKGKFFNTQTYQLKENGTQIEFNTYYYHPCSDELVNITDKATTNTCTEPLSICRHKNVIDLNLSNGTFKLDDNNEFLGKTSVSNFSDDGKTITYFNGPSKTLVTLVCALSDNNLVVNSEDDPSALILTFNSKDACLKQLSEPTIAGRSLGSTLLVILFSIVILYLVLGICTKKFLMGATGLEVIPNLGFWSDLPNLVKDGWAFMINGFKLPARGSGPVSSPDPNSYDSI